MAEEIKQTRVRAYYGDGGGQRPFTEALTEQMVERQIILHQESGKPAWEGPSPSRYRDGLWIYQAELVNIFGTGMAYRAVPVTGYPSSLPYKPIVTQLEALTTVVRSVEELRAVVEAVQEVDRRAKGSVDPALKTGMIRLCDVRFEQPQPVERWPLGPVAPHRYTVIDAWRCGRCGVLGFRKHSAAHFDSDSCGYEVKKAALLAQGIKPIVDYLSEAGGGAHATLTAGQVYWVAEHYNLGKHLGCYWVTPPMQEAVFAYLRDKLAGGRMPSLAAHLRASGLVPIRSQMKLKPANGGTCLACDTPSSNGDSALVLFGQQYRFCQKHAEAMAVQLDSFLEQK
jgi:hypothetical protein